MAEVSLCIPVFNSAAFLDGLFSCLRALSPPPAEIILLDDASTDDSALLLHEFSENPTLGVPVRVLVNERNLGIAGAYNRLVREARHEWIQLLDADDLLVGRDFYDRIEPALNSAADLVIVALTSNARLLHWGATMFGWIVPRRPPLWWPLLGSFSTRAGVLYRRLRLIDHPFYDPAYPGSDVIHLLELRREGLCIYLRKPQVLYRVHPDSQSSRHRDYSVYRSDLKRFGLVVRTMHRLDLRLRQLVQKAVR